MIINLEIFRKMKNKILSIAFLAFVLNAKAQYTGVPVKTDSNTSTIVAFLVFATLVILIIIGIKQQNSNKSKKVRTNNFDSKKQSSNPLEDLLSFVRLWMESSKPVSENGKLVDFMDSYTKDWHVGRYKGNTEEVYNWLKKCVEKDLASPGRGDFEIFHIDALKYKGRYGRISFEKIGWWDKYGVSDSVIQIGVSGAYHVIGKASNNEFYYLGHQ